MKTHVILAGLVLAAGSCDQDHHVTILLGPDEATLSRGFTCFQSEAPLIPGVTDLLLWRGFIREAGTDAFPKGRIEFNMVIDFLALGDGSPSCRGEDILNWCKTRGGCGAIFLPQRYCVPIAIHNVDTAQWVTQAGQEAFRDSALREVYDEMGAAGDVIADAPDDMVIVRAVATTQSCASLTTPITGDHYAAFDNSETSTTLLGCAYSCPVLLDAVKSAVELSLDGSDFRCEPEVRACAGDLQSFGGLGD